MEKTMNIIGINAFNHDPGVCLIKDGIIVAAIEEEKITRQKNITGFPIASIQECLKLANLTNKDIDIIAIPRQLILEFSWHAFHILRHFPKSMNLFKKETTAVDNPVKTRSQKLFNLHNILKDIFHPKIKIIEISHHESHALSVFHQSQFESSVVVVADGIAEYDTTWIGYINNGNIEKKKSIKFPDSFGMAYAAITDFLGFQAFSDEWKVMGMSAYGTPKYYEEISKLFTVRHNLDFELSSIFEFKYYGKRKWFSDNFVFNHLKRNPSSPLTQDHFDLARSFQSVFEDKLIHFFRMIKNVYPNETKVCLSGGVFYNCLFNGRLSNEKIFDNVYCDSNPGDAGSALGAACYAYKKVTGKMPQKLNHSNRLGRSFQDDEIKKALTTSGIRFKEISDFSEVANEIQLKGVIGFFQGPAEFGARALGSRSILADPRNPNNKDIINSRVKYRESFRPFAPSICFEDQLRFFNDPIFSPYMSFAIEAKKDAKSLIPAVIHEDNTSRIQSVLAESDPTFHKVIKDFEKITSIPVLLNTSFNIKGEPIVYSIGDALKTLQRAQISSMCIGSFLVYNDKI
jgi:carbamoyltransferase